MSNLNIKDKSSDSLNNNRETLTPKSPKYLENKKNANSLSANNWNKEKSQKEKILEVTEKVFNFTPTRKCSVLVQRSKSAANELQPLRFSLANEKDSKKNHTNDEYKKPDLECCTNNDDTLSLNESPKVSQVDNYLPSWYQKKFFYNKSQEWKEYSNNLVDSHCHFEMLFYR